ncbi:23S rRNA (pseudouridine(1915)-N(3))-methyltransferase RlmH [Thermotalea metallivorans]|uniref:Ribosomal RNA large subunit methyltransferase H n=1 Tax=Thermotalea metallivorans TaxID=520762 RepID=A0A140L049_9FIRM|nr:23S rRNA (pseudouridine(1915)-N(3))-methyltransferase RlmH [Thermotalea metallivorans]KXG73924.1 Ribosomal RNA large subunit methyltransferase H [Thermotalea metallivorans]
MNITIIGVGKVKEDFFAKAIDEYGKRLRRYCKLNIIEVPDEKAPESLSDKEMENVKNVEGENILKHVKDGMYVIALDVKGKMLSSQELADTLEKLGVTGNSSLAFIIGGSLGLSNEVLKRADFRLSFSPMTFPHQLMRVILLEQIYRGFRIMRGEPYHK